MNSTLLHKYNKQVPRYTSYPTVPHWEEQSPNQDTWIKNTKFVFEHRNKEKGIAIYIHLPYCEALCHYCACNKVISRNHNVEKPYINALIKEWNLYKQLIGGTPFVAEIHLGGGTPTFFAPENLKYLLESILEGCQIAPFYEFSFEGHPNNTTFEHLDTLKQLGFDRVSFGVQDFDPVVQNSINRVQPYSRVKEVTQWSKELGYKSINFDLIYGLPNQTIYSIENTFKKVLDLKPDRIAFYSYAHVPWQSGIQRKFNEDDLPSGENKKALCDHGKSILKESDYVEIGMDHFSLKSDSLYIARTNNKLHRNFMGYNTNNCEILIGLGNSSITDIGNAYMQNVKGVGSYINSINNNRFAIIKGHYLSNEDLRSRKHILNLMCKGETMINSDDALQYFESNKFFTQLINDGLITVTDSVLRINDFALPLMRSICVVFDTYMKQDIESENKFSLAV